MMGTKVWIALCALLLINSGSANHNEDHAAASSAPKSATGGEVEMAPESVPGSTVDPISSTTLSNPSSSTSTKGETISVTPEPKRVNDTKINSTSEAALPKTNVNLTGQSTIRPSVPPSESQAPVADTPLTPTPPHTTHPTAVDTPTTMAPTTHPAALPPDSVTPSNQTTHNETHSSTPVPTSEPPKPDTTTTTVIAQSSSTSSTSSSQKPPNSESPMLTSPQHTPQSDGHPETSSEAHLKSTINPPSSPSAQADPRADTPSQLNIGGDPTMVHDSPTLDPLLAGLVSAFIITAVIITLLLFLKLRQRDNRPEFRRLQDLPMDDMMEDTPLSMYSY
ncbi:proline-rich receptor-like protein kinase PERK2 isoform X1 [Sander lucioperca]|uniref:proline-rich receptor-like protein kinase PERK2 isoform X1 n=1 Tax=Sander lucioperca TaxID=283035 RepID=UPI001653BFDC|nr:proline-rich receptor-like protein kinase PERK2 isoform X1 [Sander lucioperca]